MLQMCHDSLRRFPVPFRRNGALLPLPGHQAREGRREFARIGSDQLVGPDRHGLRPFGVIAQGQTGSLQQLESFEPAGGSVKGDGRFTAAQPVR